MYQMKVLDMSIIIACLIVAKGELFMDICALELGVVDRVSDKEA